MKKCPNCGFENDPDAQFCAKCGTKLTTDQQTTTTTTTQPRTTRQENQPASNHQSSKHTLLIVMIVIIVVLLAAIFFLIGSGTFSNNSSSSSSTAPQSAKTSTSTSQKQSAAQTSSQSSSQSANHSSANRNQLVLSQMNDKEKAVAAYYYATKQNKQFGDFDTAQQNGGLEISTNLTYKYDQGTNPVGLMPLKTGSGAIPFYTTDGNQVYFYIPTAGPAIDSATRENNKLHTKPIIEASWQDIIKEVNDNDAASAVKNVANGSHIN